MPDENLRIVYQQLCDSYRAIDDFRAKLLGFLPLATGGIFLILPTNHVQQYWGPIGVFGFVITFGLFCYELYGIKKCDHLIEAGKDIERQMKICGQFRTRPHGIAGFIHEPFAARIIYPAVLVAWMFLTLAFLWPQVALLPSYILWMTIVVVSLFYGLLQKGRKKPAIECVTMTKQDQHDI